MVLLVIIVNGWKPLTIITKSSILDIAAFLDPPLKKLMVCCINVSMYQLVSMVIAFLESFCSYLES